MADQPPEQARPPNNTIHNERTKLSATALNGLVIAATVAGFITPIAAVSFRVPGPVSEDGLITLLVAAAWLAVGFVLHLLARALLGRLRP
jgi:hypothetical protein